MTFFEKLDKLCKANGMNTMNIGKIIPDLSCGRSTVCEWKTRGAHPRIETVKAISNYFKVPMEYLLNDNLDSFVDEETAKPKVETPYYIGELEEELLWVANRLSVKNRAKLVSLAHDMLDSENEQKGR